MTNNIVDFENRAAALEQEYIALAAAYIESRPFGSFVSKEQMSAALRDHRVELFAVQDYLEDTGSEHRFWACRKDKRYVGLFILTADAYIQYRNYQL